MLYKKKNEWYLLKFTSYNTNKLAKEYTKYIFYS